MFQNITELKELTLRAENREKQQAVVANLGMRALDGVEPYNLIEQAVRDVMSTLDVDYCKVLEYRPQREDFLMKAGAGWKEGVVGKVTVPQGPNSQAGFALMSKALC